METIILFKEAKISHNKNDLVLFNFIFNLNRFLKGGNKLFLQTFLVFALAMLFCQNINLKILQL